MIVEQVCPTGRVKDPRLRARKHQHRFDRQIVMLVDESMRQQFAMI